MSRSISLSRGRPRRQGASQRQVEAITRGVMEDLLEFSETSREIKALLEEYVEEEKAQDRFGLERCTYLLFEDCASAPV